MFSRYSLIWFLTFIRVALASPGDFSANYLHVCVSDRTIVLLVFFRVCFQLLHPLFNFICSVVFYMDVVRDLLFIHAFCRILVCLSGVMPSFFNTSFLEIMSPIRPRSFLAYRCIPFWCDCSLYHLLLFTSNGSCTTKSNCYVVFTVKVISGLQYLLRMCLS